ncbi:MAG: DUF3667 domain-containing protein [Pseudomonadota bacterium]
MHSEICANCHATRQGAFCNVCGQSDRDYRKSLPPMLWELIAEAFELEGRLSRTMSALLLKPGLLSCEFSANRRARYVSPIRLYLFTSIIFFFVLSVTAPDIDTLEIPVQIEEPVPETTNSAGFEAWVDPERVDEFDLVVEKGWGDTLVEIRNGLAGADHEDTAIAPPDQLTRFLFNQAVKALANPTALLADLLDNVPIALFFLLPVYAGLLKLFCVRQKKYFVEHLVFALHLHAFAFLVFTIRLFLPDNPEGDATFPDQLLNLIFLVYYFLSLRRYYAQSRRKTLLKYVLLLTMYSICLAPAALLVLLVTFTLA